MTDDWMLSQGTVDARLEETFARNGRTTQPPSKGCTCRKYGVDPDCPVHGRPGQLSLEPDDKPDDRYDPSTAEIPY